MNDPFGARAELQTSDGPVRFWRLGRLEEAGLTKLAALPYAVRTLLEAVLRHCDGRVISEEDVRRLAAWAPQPEPAEVPFRPARVLLQDFTGVPVLVDLAAMRSAIERLGGDPRRINPQVPVDLVIDHSVQVDHFGTPDALGLNMALEMQRNRPRYEFLRWGRQAFENLRVVPPGTGIIHQVNLELLAQVVVRRTTPDGAEALPDTLVGTDSHTTMINGLGVLGWGVGGIEAEAAMLGQPLCFPVPEVVGVELSGRLRTGSTATDLVLTLTEMLRREGVVGKFVEYFGPALEQMDVAERAVLANMAPEYGATTGFFPIDAQTLAFLRRTGRSKAQVELVERYARAQQLFYTPDAPVPDYTTVLRLELDQVEPSLAGPKRPHDRVPLARLKQRFRKALGAPREERGFGLSGAELDRRAEVVREGRTSTIGHGSVVIAAITSCTNTSNPGLMLAAGLLARKAVARGLRVPPHVKTSLAPGSRVVTEYLERTGLNRDLEALGFHTVGYGCTTCIGNSGPLPESVAGAIDREQLVVASVLSGNRNFEGRIHAQVKANYLAGPPLVVACALAGTVDIDFEQQPLGTGKDGKPVFLKDIWPGPEELQSLGEAVEPEIFQRCYDNVFEGDAQWNALQGGQGEVYAWDEHNTYIQEPPFLTGLGPEPGPIQPIRQARVLAALGDSVTTDHISPAGAIAPDSPAGKYLISLGIGPEQFNTYGSRRGNDRVMTRGTFANIRLRNLLAPGTEGGWTRHLPDGELMSIYEAAQKYAEEGVPLVVLAGREYGTGSSRDWAAKGTRLLGVRAVIAASFERIHRSNLVGMGVLPLELPADTSWQALGLTGEELFDIEGLDDSLSPRAQLTVRATDAAGRTSEFPAIARIDTPVELDYYRHGGILPAVLRMVLSG